MTPWGCWTMGHTAIPMGTYGNPWKDNPMDVIQSEPIERKPHGCHTVKTNGFPHGSYIVYNASQR